MSLRKIWNENECFRLVFIKMLVRMSKIGFINASTEEDGRWYINQEHRPEDWGGGVGVGG
jgi:hypothetical protein